MRGFLASSIGVATAAALALPLALPTQALAAHVTPAAPAAPAAVAERAGAAAPAGSTQSLPLIPLAPPGHRAGRVPGMSAATPPDPETRGLPAREVKTFSMVGVVWDDAATELHGRVQVRTRSAETAVWSDWQDVETHNGEHSADLDAAERSSGRVRGATAPLWVGESDGVEVRVQAEPGTSDRSVVGHLPTGMRIELIDPGAAPDAAPTVLPAPVAAPVLPAAPRTPRLPGTSAGDTPGTPPGSVTGASAGKGTAPAPGTAPEKTTSKPAAKPAAKPADDKGKTPQAPQAPGLGMAAAESSAANLPLAPIGAEEITEQNKADSTADAMVAVEGGQTGVAARPYIGPRPRIITRKGWGADESLREPGFAYTGTVKAAFVHHSASGNNYTCAQAPAVLRSLYRYHVVSSGWRDFGYNFAVDKCGNVYEGRAGGVAKAVLGAHTMGFNTNSMGVAVLGSYTDTAPPAAAVTAIARLTAWKLGLYGANPLGKTTLKSGGGNLYKKGSNVKLNVISGHRDGFATECPGRKLYGKLGTARTTSARYQGR
ncbi:N-acetylmuramoyl-L-alanine amidase [Streptomyces sp. NPDC097619]|uniref:peptidoglycan recognition protein family protein n=1 Tax=Streptomyces sp. NPDC097619 TaxID=3157228 RepID=UPI00331F7E92